jgi:hypothetical protein
MSDDYFLAMPPIRLFVRWIPQVAVQFVIYMLIAHVAYKAIYTTCVQSEGGVEPPQHKYRSAKEYVLILTGRKVPIRAEISFGLYDSLTN